MPAEQGRDESKWRACSCVAHAVPPSSPASGELAAAPERAVRLSAPHLVDVFRPYVKLPRAAVRHRRHTSRLASAMSEAYELQLIQNRMLTLQVTAGPHFAKRRRRRRAGARRRISGREERPFLDRIRSLAGEPIQTRTPPQDIAAASHTPYSRSVRPREARRPISVEQKERNLR